MSNSVLFTGVLLILAAGVGAVGLARLLFKKSIVFSIVAIMTFPILNAVIMGLIVGARGLIHLVWAAPYAVAVIFLAYGIIANIMQKPLNEMFNTVDSLSSGDVDITFNEKFQKGGHELARVMRRLCKLTESLKNIVVFADHIGKGELNTEYELLGEKDTMGKSMLEMRSNLQEAEKEKEKRRQEDERRNWVTVGLAKFAELLRANNDNIEELCRSIISNLVKYIGANQGGIFILNDEDPERAVLELKACYAYERRKYVEKTINLGEGLVGTCFLERQSIYMTKLPKDYIHITSGLGDNTPRALFISPLIVNEEIYGVMEIAAFTEFEPHVREFIEKVAESIASTIGSVKINIRTNKLLEISKIQSEEMAGQEEELRQNMEEMQATQEEMRRRESELSGTLEKMKELQRQSEEKEFEAGRLYESIVKTFHAVEFSANGTLISIDKKVLGIFGNASESDFVGHSFVETYPDGETKGTQVWGKLLSGEQVTTYTDLDQTPVKLEYLPIFNKENVLQRVLTMVIPLKKTE